MRNVSCFDSVFFDAPLCLCVSYHFFFLHVHPLFISSNGYACGRFAVGFTPFYCSPFRCLGLDDTKIVFMFETAKQRVPFKGDFGTEACEKSLFLTDSQLLIRAVKIEN